MSRVILCDTIEKLSPVDCKFSAGSLLNTILVLEDFSPRIDSTVPPLLRKRRDIHESSGYEYAEVSAQIAETGS
jgi:hypothetical protein